MRMYFDEGWRVKERSPEDRFTCHVAAAIIGAAVVGAAASSYSANKSAGAEEDASQAAIGAGQTAEQRALSLQAPSREAGYRATAAMMDMTGLDRGKPSGSAVSRAQGEPPNLADYEKYDFKADPGYQFRLDQGERINERGAAARGGLLSGGFGRSATRYAEDYASNEYQAVYNRLSTIAGFGGSATSQGATTIVNTGANTGNALINAGEARASAYTATGNAWAKAANSAGSAAGYYSGGSSNLYMSDMRP